MTMYLGSNRYLNNFEINDKFFTGLYLFFKISEARPCFLIIWGMNADLQDARNHQTINKDSQYVE